MFVSSVCIEYNHPMEILRFTKIYNYMVRPTSFYVVRNWKKIEKRTVKVSQNEIFADTQVFVNSYIFPEFDRYRILVRDNRDNIFLAINVNVKEGFTRLSRSVERKGDMITLFLYQFLKQGGSPLSYELWLVSFIQDDLKPEFSFFPVL